MEPVVFVPFICLLPHIVCALTVETRSKSPCEEVPSLPWDHHMDDDLLKTLIKRAQAFEEHIRYVSLPPVPQLRNA